jgi:hypothetical protein
MIERSLLVVLLALAACGKSAPKKRTLEVRVRTGALVGATITVDGQRKWIADQDPSYQYFTLSEKASTTVQVEMDTPCGPRPLAGVVQAPDPNQRCEGERICVVLSLPDGADTGRRIPVWTDAPAGTVKVGETVAAPIGLRAPDCAARIPVTIDGKEVGVLEADKGAKSIAGVDAKVEGVFVTATADACYRLSSIAYGEAPSQGSRILRGGNVYPLADGSIEFFLEAAPDTVMANPKYETGKTLTELVRVDCPAP